MSAEGEGVELTFGECEGLCGGMVERVGWDRYCYACQDEMKREDEERDEALYDEDEFLYSIPSPSTSATATAVAPKSDQSAAGAVPGETQR